ncbi:MAG TPA: DUF2255 family protein [Pyrinomonadaceae bacterium]|nr:DUF2255 family protein [Pyrinomonadaceae bacterium]
MKAHRFPEKIVAAVRDAKIIGIRAGTKPHRIIGIWTVVVENRVFVRSWGLKERGWYSTFLEDPVGVILVDGREIPVSAVFTRSERLKTLVDKAYAEKFNTPGSRHFVQGFVRSKKRRDTTTELVMRKKGKGERVKGNKVSSSKSQVSGSRSR